VDQFWTKGSLTVAGSPSTGWRLLSTWGEHWMNQRKECYLSFSAGRGQCSPLQIAFLAPLPDTSLSAVYHWRNPRVAAEAAAAGPMAQRLIHKWFLVLSCANFVRPWAASFLMLRPTVQWVSALELASLYGVPLGHPQGHLQQHEQQQQEQDEQQLPRQPWKQPRDVTDAPTVGAQAMDSRGAGRPTGTSTEQQDTAAMRADPEGTTPVQIITGQGRGRASWRTEAHVVCLQTKYAGRTLEALR